MSRAVQFKPEHRQAMHTLREWARRVGKSQPGVTNQEREALAQARAPHTPHSEPLPEAPAPDTLTEGAD